MDLNPVLIIQLLAHRDQRKTLFFNLQLDDFLLGLIGLMQFSGVCHDY